MTLSSSRLPVTLGAGSPLRGQPGSSTSLTRTASARGASTPSRSSPLRLQVVAAPGSPAGGRHTVNATSSPMSPAATEAALVPLFNTLEHWGGGGEVADKMMMTMLGSLPNAAKPAACNMRGPGGFTLLMTACRNHAAPVVRTLLEIGECAPVGGLCAAQQECAVVVALPRDLIANLCVFLL